MVMTSAFRPAKWNKNCCYTSFVSRLYFSYFTLLDVLLFFSFAFPLADTNTGDWRLHGWMVLIQGIVWCQKMVMMDFSWLLEMN